MTYDAIGNMLTRGGTTYTWTQGRRLLSVENGKSIQYLYDHIGARVKKNSGQYSDGISVGGRSSSFREN